MSKKTFFDHAVSMKTGKTKALKYQSQIDLMNRRFEALLSIDYDSSKVGVKIKAMEWADRVSYVGQCLGGRSLNTLKKRYGQICRYVRFVNKEFFQMPFPFVDDLMKGYMSHLEEPQVIRFFWILGIGCIFGTCSGMYSSVWLLYRSMDERDLAWHEVDEKAQTSIKDVEGN